MRLHWRSGGCGIVLEQIRNRPVRRNVATLASNDPILEAYRAGISAMRALPSSDPRNWERQAQIHQQFCPHCSWFFLPWHRAYLLSFERIIRELSGKADFALPYWNWSCGRAIPAPFWQAGSPLFHSPRSATQSSQADASIVGASNIATILDETDFELFASGSATTLRPGTVQGLLEGGPHNHIHNFVGGTMGGFLSPLDPIFWLHHNFIDYLWFDWNSRGNANSNDPAYQNFMISGQMVDGAGNPVDDRVGALILAPLLSYRFEPPGNGFRISRFLADEVALRRLLEKGADVRLRPLSELPVAARGLALDPRQRTRADVRLDPGAMRAAAAPDAKARLVLRIDDIRPPADDTFVRVFVGLPEGAPATVDSPHYAGALAFFVHEGDHGGHDEPVISSYVDLTPAFRKLGGRVPDRSTVTLVPVRVREQAGPPAPLVLGTVRPLVIAAKPLPDGPK